MKNEHFWSKSYDKDIDDLDPKLWETTLVESFNQSFMEFKDKAALTFMGVAVTYAELDKYSNRFANMLIANGFKKGDVIGIDMANIPEYVISVLGTLKAGCIVSGVSPLLSAEEIEFQLKDSEAKGFSTLDAIFEKHLAKIHSNLPALKLVAVASIGGFLPKIKNFLGNLLGKIPKGKITPLEGKKIYTFNEIIKTDTFSADSPEIKLTPDDIAYLQYTGGTTGMPKGAILTHRNALADMHIVLNWLFIEKGKGVALSAFPLFHIAGLFTCTCFLYYGVTQVLIPNPRDTDHICAELEKYKPFITANVPSLYHLLLSNPKFYKLDHSSLKICISAAASYPEEAQKKLEDIIGRGKLLEAYGMTETSPLTVMNPTKGKKKLGCIGLPLTNTDIKLIDPSTGKEAAIGEPGEICIKGPQIMKGYFKQPEETKTAINENGYMFTGDVAVQDNEGYLKIVDRTKDMINVSGFKVFSKKIEEILSAHPAIQEIATIGIPDPNKPGSEFVKAFIIISEKYKNAGNKDSLAEEITAFAKEKLSAYEVPKKIAFRNELPLTSVGKLDKKALRREI